MRWTAAMRRKQSEKIKAALANKRAENGHVVAKATSDFDSIVREVIREEARVYVREVLGR